MTDFSECKKIESEIQEAWHSFINADASTMENLEHFKKLDPVGQVDQLIKLSFQSGYLAGARNTLDTLEGTACVTMK